MRGKTYACFAGPLIAGTYNMGTLTLALNLLLELIMRSSQLSIYRYDRLPNPNLNSAHAQDRVAPANNHLPLIERLPGRSSPSDY